MANKSLLVLLCVVAALALFATPAHAFGAGKIDILMQSILSLYCTDRELQKATLHPSQKSKAVTGDMVFENPTRYIQIIHIDKYSGDIEDMLKTVAFLKKHKVG